ncbi:hypothetical protein BpHYR1_006412 [Brachionus plicatilis]|uniref:Uncharacterized protein n=1 Tax=Brachionus plicatilis TaxID=10195 RepID=A0A3M7P2H5_BRAPC|nr:hypothetical protein BpHYR1_006412 [Brachionus plicatilis]
MLIHIKSFAIHKPMFQPLKKFWKILYLKIFHSKFQFDNNCDTNIDPKIFKSIDSIEFAFTVKYYTNTCPLIFTNTDLLYLKFHGLSSCFLKKNLIDFNQTINVSNLNSTIGEIHLNFFKGSLTKKFVIFTNVSTITISGLIDYIEDSAFELVNLKTIGIDVNKNLITNGFAWLNRAFLTNSLNIFVLIKIQNKNLTNTNPVFEKLMLINSLCLK